MVSDIFSRNYFGDPRYRSRQRRAFGDDVLRCRICETGDEMSEIKEVRRWEIKRTKQDGNLGLNVLIDSLNPGEHKEFVEAKYYDAALEREAKLKDQVKAAYILLREGKAKFTPHTTNSYVDEWLADYKKGQP